MSTPHRRLANRRRFVPILVALVALARCLFSSSSDASEAARVVIVTEGELPPAGERVRAELAAMGFAVMLDEDGSRQPTRDALAEAARSRDAVAAIALTFSGEGVDLWVVERAKQETRLHSFVAAEHAATDPTLALRTSELLRATLLALSAEGAAAVPAAQEQAPKQQVPPAAPPEPAAPASAAALAAPLHLPAESSRAVSFRLGTGLVMSAGGLGAFPSFELGAKWWFTEHLAAEISALVPLARMSQRGTEGSSSTRVGALSLVLGASLPLGNSDWIWDLGAGMAAVALETRGSPATVAYTREHDFAAGVAPLLQSGLSVPLARRLRVGVGVSLGLSVPRFLILYADRTAATWGRPFAAGELAVELEVP